MTGLPHAVFLQRVADEPATSPEVQLGQGAFLALRFVDLLAPDREHPTTDVFRYQWAATERYCAELAGEGTEAAHLSGIVRATGEAHRVNEVRLLAPALLAYALYLEEESHLGEADDVLQTLLRTGGTLLAGTDVIAAWLRLGRVRRKQADFEGAMASYAEAGRAAESAGDQSSVLLSRIGQCNVFHFRGNLPEAERAWRSVLADASAGGFRTAEAHAQHGLGTVLQRRGLAHESAPHLWRAYELYEDPISQLRALGDLSTALVALGDVAAAERALDEVVRRGGPTEIVANARVELMNCASFRRDRVAFERCREHALASIGEAAPNVRADYHLKAGIGFARFGSYRRAEQELRESLEVASAHGLHELVFRIERISNGLRDCAAPERLQDAAAEPMVHTDALREVSTSLAALRS
jgi:hypothetical protein